ncbi:MAG TPA: PH domain-containing protein [Streptosporangiaceae bacterium]|nr:PH domain-containing protein [Streptosporangiaceae bacterium]
MTSQLPSYPGSGPGPAEGTGPGPGTAASAPGRSAGSSPDDGMADWHRLHPLSPLVRSGRHFTGLLILLVLLVVANGRKSGGSEFISEGVVIAVVLILGIINWAVTRWRVERGVLFIETGLIRRQSLRFPLSQVQAIDVVQTGLARTLGLAAIQLRMAGADSSDAKLLALRKAEALRLREELLSLSKVSHSSAGQTGASQTGASQTGAAVPAPRTQAAVPTATPAQPQADERVLFHVHPGRLAAGLIFSITGVVMVVIIAAIVVLAVVVHSSTANASYLPVLIGAIIGVWRQFNGQYGTTVALAPDGVRLRSGLVQTTAETIRPGRIQAVRLVEPLVWRWFGWAKLEVDVAGPRQRRENRSESKRLRALVPVGTRAEAEKMLAELVADPPQPTERPPGSTRWKAPLNYHFLAFGGDDHYVVASRGRLRRTITWVPLEKVQSVRWVQGPVQRRLGLASVKLDVAGKRVTASATDRTVSEAAELLTRLPAQARAARLRTATPASTGAEPAPARSDS